MKKWIRKYFEIERVICFSMIPLSMLFLLILFSGGQWVIFCILAAFLVIFIFSICPCCKTSIITYSRLHGFPLFSAIFINEPVLMCPKCKFPYNECEDFGVKNKYFQVSILVLWRSILLYILFMSSAAVTFFYIFGPMFLDLIVLSHAWGLLGAAIGNIWYIFKFGSYERLLLFTTGFIGVFIFINLLFMPNAIGYRKNLNDIRGLSNKSIIEIRVSDHAKKRIKSKLEIEKLRNLLKSQKWLKYTI
jgi:hypothetical protein